MSKLVLSFRVNPDLFTLLAEEASAAGVNSPNDYVRQLVEQRHNKAFQIGDSNSIAAIAKLEGKVENLNEQLEKAQKQAFAFNEKASLNGIELQNGSVQEQIQEALDKQAAAHKLEGLEATVEDLEHELETVGKERDEYKALVDSDARTAKLIERGSQALEVVGRIAPKPIERIMNGLAGLLGGGGDLGGLSEEQTTALTAGNAIFQDFSPEDRPYVIEILRYLSRQPKAMVQLVKSKPFVGWLQQQQIQQP